jgi:hypothetical protein
MLNREFGCIHFKLKPLNLSYKFKSSLSKDEDGTYLPLQQVIFHERDVLIFVSVPKKLL